MQRDIQQAVERVLAIERQAQAIVDGGEEEARYIRTRAVEVARVAREQVLEKARREAEDIVAAATAQSERERDRRMAETVLEVERMERLAGRFREGAVRFAVASLAAGPIARAKGPTARGQRRVA